MGKKREQDFLSSLLVLNKNILTQSISSGSIVVDATLGNGNDAVFLAGLVGKQGKLYGFDIQKEAIRNSVQKMEENGLENYVFMEEGHENIDSYVEAADAVVFNLGYLPGFSKETITKPETTLEAVRKSLNILRPEGVLSIMFYTGHPGGGEERDLVLSFISSLAKSEYDVLQIEHLNRGKAAPFLIIIRKKGESDNEKYKAEENTANY